VPFLISNQQIEADTVRALELGHDKFGRPWRALFFLPEGV
jgi:hypothetical protein